MKVDRPSDLGAWSYEVEDTKLARQVKPAALLQLAAYAEHVARIQGHPPDHIHVRLGTMERRPFPLRELAAYHRTVRAQFEAALAADTETYPDPVSHCALCRWAGVCHGRRRDDDHLSLVAGMRRDQTRKFADTGITTVEELADAPPDVRPRRMGATTTERLREQARLQVVDVAPGSAPTNCSSRSATAGCASCPSCPPAICSSTWRATRSSVTRGWSTSSAPAAAAGRTTIPGRRLRAGSSRRVHPAWHVRPSHEPPRRLRRRQPR